MSLPWWRRRFTIMGRHAKRRGTTGRGRWLVALVAVSIASVALPASAATIADPPYARGPLDLKRLTATKHDATAPIHLTLLTYGSWDASLLDVAGSNRIFFEFNPDRSGRPDYIGEVRFRDGHLWVRLTNRRGGFIRRVRAYHPAGDVLKTTIPRGLPNPDGNAWLAARERYTTASGPCATTCTDRIPSGGGWLKLTPGQ
jgi:hypothetical protein